MNKLEELRAELDVSVSPDLRSEVVRFTKDYGKLSHRHRYYRMRDILDGYYREKTPPKGIQPWQVLAILATALSGERWNTGKFTYYFNIGRKGVIAEAAWDIIEKCGFLPSRFQKVLEHTTALNREKGVPLPEALQSVLAALEKVQKPGREQDSWYENLWCEDRWDLIREHFELSVKAGQGQRKCKPKRTRKAAKSTPVTKRFRVTMTKQEKEKSAELKQAFASWLDERLQDVPEEFRGLERALAQREFDRTLQFIRAQTLEQISAKQLGDRTEYQRACEVFGVEAPSDGIVNEKLLKPRYRSLASKLHTDHNPHLDGEALVQLKAQYDHVIKSYKVIQAFNERFSHGAQ